MNEIEDIKKDIRDIKENHLPHLKREVVKVKVNQEWLMKFFWIIATASIAGLITGIINLMS